VPFGRQPVVLFFPGFPASRIRPSFPDLARWGTYPSPPRILFLFPRSQDLNRSPPAHAFSFGSCDFCFSLTPDRWALNVRAPCPPTAAGGFFSPRFKARLKNASSCFFFFLSCQYLPPPPPYIFFSFVYYFLPSMTMCPTQPFFCSKARDHA